ncbi:DUF4157 domain-containing protein [Ascidiimonas aurantiaca]|uniref:eCIS core domain-containing protein n=1 Tax=Ascidiimonas aurantiaca TaxID=1685432 RepID=UPI0030EB189A
MHTHQKKNPKKSRETLYGSKSGSESNSIKASKFQDTRPEALQMRKLQYMADGFTGQLHPVQKKHNTTGLPDTLKTGIETLSGHRMDDVKVHYNSSKPSQLQAHAYAQGTQIHLASGQEKHLPHEAWHVVQQKQGRVKPTAQLQGKVPVNDDVSLEKEADVMWARALQMKSKGTLKSNKPLLSAGPLTVQRVKSDLFAWAPKTVPANTTPVQRVEITRLNVTNEVWQAYRELSNEAKLLLRYSTFPQFFELSREEQLDFLHALNHSTTVINTLMQQQAPALMGPDYVEDKEPPLRQLQAQFLQLNPDFLGNLLGVTQGHGGSFYFSHDLSIHITNFSAIRTPQPHKALLGPQEQKISKALVKQSQVSIHSVMEEKSLSKFLLAQHLFQQAMRSMDDLKSIGFEFEFASFTGPDGVYTANEIIPSHQLMAQSAIGGNYFGLSWRLESDSKNTLELVSPPFVFSRNKQGETKSYAIRRELEKETGTLAITASQHSYTLLQTAGALSQAHIGFGWKVNPDYQNFLVTTNKKSGGVYSQQNVSLYPEEIGSMLEEKFRGEDKLEPPAVSLAAATYPTNVARLVRKHFLAVLPEEPAPAEAVQQAIAVFSRYASNVLAIPSLRHRQDNDERKDNMATQVKETLGVWVKTDPLNLLMHLLKDPENMEAFHIALAAARQPILQVFETAGQKFVNDVRLPPPQDPTIPEIGARMQLLIQQNPQMAQDRMATMQLAKQQLIQERAQQQGPDPSVAVGGYVAEMLQDLTAFIERALHVNLHEEAHPKSTTSEFLDETFGTGEGVRKGTYLKGVKTSKGPMYVTELR